MSHLIFVGGPSCSGKSQLIRTLSSYLTDLKGLSVGSLQIENYRIDHSDMSHDDRWSINRLNPKELDHKLLREHLISVKKKLSFPRLHYDTSKYQRIVMDMVSRKFDVLFVEGELIFCLQNLLDLASLNIFVSTPLTECLKRYVARVEQLRPAFATLAEDYWDKHIKPLTVKNVIPSVSKTPCHFISREKEKDHMIWDIIKELEKVIWPVPESSESRSVSREFTSLEVWEN